MDMIAQDLLAYESKSLTVDGLSGSTWTMRYLDEGPTSHTPSDQPDSNPSDSGPILCVHGNPTWSFYFRRVVQRFSSARRVVAVDHLGCGRSDKPAKSEFDYCLASHRDNLVRLIDQLDLSQTTLLAHDWGGAIGLAALCERRDRFKRIVLLNTGAFPPPYLPLRIAACRWPLVGPLGVRGFNAFARAAQTMTVSRQPLPPDVRRGMIAPYDSWANRVAIDAFVQDIPMHRSHRTFPVLQKLESELPSLSGLPILLIWGMQDWCFRPECLERFQGHWPNATVVPIEDAGHYVLEDAPNETLNAIDEFLQST
ncbi:alpha/beta fold hydrolase [Crateriforma spongiae]|uniref:alpha/beta fold hydrolase n=1 Tax=Crateriforma spongiae TaxID=2724528 RepID=UPI0039B043DB